MANMPGVNANRDHILANRLTELRLHFGKCKECRGAMKAQTFDDLCQWAKSQLVSVAAQWDRNISVRLKIRNSCLPYLYPCPDTSAHGKTYELTAEAYLINGFQDRLF